MIRSKGFTLTELLIVLALAAILATLAAPNFRDFVRSTRMTSEANSLVLGLNLARSESVKRGRRVNLSSASGDEFWTTGWAMYEDTDADGTQDGGEPSIRVGEGMDPPLTLEETVNSASFISYQSSGVLSVSPATRAFDLCESDRNGETGRQITISVTGRVSIADFDCP